MTIKRAAAVSAGAAAGLLGAGLLGYAAYAGSAWLNYGHAPAPAAGEADPLLDVFMPRYDVVERHSVGVGASADATFAALMNLSLEDSPVVRAIFRARELVLGAEPDRADRPRTLVEATKELGWVVLAEVPGHEIVMGAVTRPWQANVTFRGIPSEHFAAFDEPDYVKIVWTLRADGLSEFSSIARSETRAVATDRAARRKFRWYWARFAAGIALIRTESMRLVRRAAEAGAGPHSPDGRSTDTVVPPVPGTSM